MRGFKNFPPPKAAVISRRNAPAPSTSPSSVDQACEQYRQELRRFFERRAPQADCADDLVQLVYLRLLGRPLAVVNDPRLFMYRVAWNVLRDENQRVEREQRRAISCDPEQLKQLAEQLGSLWVDDSGEDLVQEQVEQVLRQLPRACQVAFLRQYRDNYTYAEIAEELGVTSHLVKKYIVKALNHFRMHFSALDAQRRQPGKVS